MDRTMLGLISLVTGIKEGEALRKQRELENQQKQQQLGTEAADRQRQIAVEEARNARAEAEARREAELQPYRLKEAQQEQESRAKKLAPTSTFLTSDQIREAEKQGYWMNPAKGELERSYPPEEKKETIRYVKRTRTNPDGSVDEWYVPVTEAQEPLPSRGAPKAPLVTGYDATGQSIRLPDVPGQQLGEKPPKPEYEKNISPPIANALVLLGSKSKLAKETVDRIRSRATPLDMNDVQMLRAEASRLATEALEDRDGNFAGYSLSAAESAAVLQAITELEKQARQASMLPALPASGALDDLWE